uniref:Uncharacterized protein n=1 Tax=Brassica campestris TaxID=3711 RepID=M4F1J0_BRACM
MGVHILLIDAKASINVRHLNTFKYLFKKWSLYEQSGFDVSLLRRCVGYNSEDVMFLEDNRVSKTTSVQGYESDWLGRWTQPGNEVNYHDQSYNGDSNDLIRPEEKIPDEANQLLKGSKVSMKLEGNIFGGYLELFPNADHQHRGGVRVQSLGISKY